MLAAGLLCVDLWDDVVHLVHSEEATEIIWDTVQHWGYQSHIQYNTQKLYMESPPLTSQKEAEGETTSRCTEIQSW